MEFWGYSLILIGVIYLIVRIVKICRDARPKEDAESEDRTPNTSNVYVIDEEFYPENNRTELPSYSEACSTNEISRVGLPPPPYEPPPEYTQIAVSRY